MSARYRIDYAEDKRARAAECPDASWDVELPADATRRQVLGAARKAIGLPARTRIRLRWDRPGYGIRYDLVGAPGQIVVRRAD